MKRLLPVALAGLSYLVLMAAPARAMMIAPPPIGQRAAVADVIVVGKVTGVGDRLVSAVPPGGADKVNYQVAVVEVSDPIFGVKDVKEVRVGFIPPPPPDPPPTGPGPFVLRKRYPQFNLAPGQEACLFLVKHPTEDFYTGANYYDILNKNGGDFDKEMDEVRHAVKLLSDPAAGLQSKSAEDRFLTAALLVTRYRTPRPGRTKAEPVDAEQSKQVLRALADADWDPKPTPGLGGFYLTPQAIFFRLNLTPQDGWTQPKDAKDIPDAAKKWLKDNAATYRIQRFVADKGDK